MTLTDSRTAAEQILAAMECSQSRCRCQISTRRGHGNTHCPVHQDNSPSFGVVVRNGSLLTHCYSGCSQTSVVEALKARGVWPEREATYVADKEILAEYDYKDADGHVLYQAVRYWPKEFKQRRPAGQPGRWTWNLEGVQRVLYRLPDLLHAEPNRVRWILEGEKDVDRAWASGLVATCNVGGAGKWRDDYADTFRGKKVVIVVDNDDPGRNHARDIARSLTGVAAEIFWLELPGLDDHGDLSDWFDDGGTLAQLQDLLKQASHPDVQPKRGPEMQVTSDEILYSWPEEQIRCTFSRLRETDSSMLRGYIEVVSQRPDAGDNGLVTWQHINLTNQTDKDRIAKRLVKAAPRDEDLWVHDVEIAFREVARAFMTVPPPQDLADVAESTAQSGYLFRPIAPHGQVCEFLADQGTTKSYLILYLLMCTALGRESIFGMPTVVGPAIFFDWETDIETVRRRLGWISRGMGLLEPPRGLHYVNMSDRGKLMDRARDMRHQIATTGAVAIGIDSLTFATGGDLAGSDISAPTMSAIGGLGPGVTKLVSTHPPKASRKGDATDVSAVGSGLFEFRARGIWHLQRPREFSPSFIVSMTQHKNSDDERFGPLYYRVSFDRNRQAVSFSNATADDEPELSNRVESARSKILRYLQRIPAHQANISSIAREIEERPDTVRRTCNRMEDVLQRLGSDSATAVWALRQNTNGTNGHVRVDVRDTEILVPGQSRSTDDPQIGGENGDQTDDGQDLPW